MRSASATDSSRCVTRRHAAYRSQLTQRIHPRFLPPLLQPCVDLFTWFASRVQSLSSTSPMFVCRDFVSISRKWRQNHRHQMTSACTHPIKSLNAHAPQLNSSWAGTLCTHPVLRAQVTLHPPPSRSMHPPHAAALTPGCRPWRARHGRAVGGEQV
jgi:hypothetical protein